MRLAYAVAAIALLATPVSAATVTTVLEGTVVSGRDVFDTFGVGIVNTFLGADLAGEAFFLALTYDAEAAGMRSTNASSDQANGGSFANRGASPFSSAVLTINGQGFSLELGYSDSILLAAQGSQDLFDFGIIGRQFANVGNNPTLIANDSIGTTLAFAPGTLPIDLDVPLPDAEPLAMAGTGSQFSLQRYDPVARQYTTRVNGSLRFTSLFSPSMDPGDGDGDGGLSPVPLPAGLPLLAAGLAAFGLVSRRRAPA